MSSQMVAHCPLSCFFVSIHPRSAAGGHGERPERGNDPAGLWLLAHLEHQGHVRWSLGRERFDGFCGRNETDVRMFGFFGLEHG